MELGKLEEISIDKVCRTCLTSGNDEELMISLTDDYDLISETFLITVSSKIQFLISSSAETICF